VGAGGGRKMKGHIGYSPITGKVYIGTHNGKVWRGDKNDITDDFIQVMIQKFPPGFSYTISIDGIDRYKFTVREIREEEK
jgi:hypothetical protein